MFFEGRCEGFRDLLFDGCTNCVSKSWDNLFSDFVNDGLLKELADVVVKDAGNGFEDRFVALVFGGLGR